MLISFWLTDIDMLASWAQLLDGLSLNNFAIGYH